MKIPVMNIFKILYLAGVISIFSQLPASKEIALASTTPARFFSDNEKSQLPNAGKLSNSASTIIGSPDIHTVQCPDVRYSLQGGFYQESQSLQLSATSVIPGLIIYYTLDGSDPDSTDLPYLAPIILDSTVVIRARSFAPGFEPGSIVSRTFFISEDCTLPIVSLATDPYNLWDEDYGIYVKGKHAQSSIPYYGANFWMDWERPAHIEFFEPGMDSAAFALNVGIKIFGGWSRANAQKSLAIYARKQYDSRDIDYRIFPDRDITHFEAFVMRNSGNDWQYTMMRDGFMQSLLFGEMDMETLAFRPAVLFLNGQYWGILNLREKVNDRYLQAHKNIDPDYIDLLELHPSNPVSVVLQGSNDHYEQMVKYISKNDMKSAAAYQHVASLMDVENFIHYMLAQIYFGNTDWPGNNIKFWRPAIDGGKWRWIVFDTDFGFGLYDQSGYLHNTLDFATEPNGPGYPNPPYSTLILRKLLENNVFRNEFINQFADHMNTTFHPDRVNEIMDYYVSILEPELPRHKQKWPNSARNFQSSIDVMKDFVEKRKGNIHSFMKEKFSLRGTYTIKLNFAGSPNSRININSHKIADFSWQGVYFLDVPITLSAVPEAGYTFTGWSGGIQSDALAIIYPSSKSVTITANFAPSAQTGNTIVINEINFNSNNLMNPHDWIEFYNYSNQSLDLQGWRFKDSDDSHEFIFPAESIIPAQGYLVLCRDTLAFKQVHSGVGCYSGNLDFDFNNDGELLRLYDSYQTLVDSLTYSTKAPWPAGMDGSGSTIELLDPLADNSQPQNWELSSNFGGTPGAANSYLLHYEEDEKAVTDFSLLQNYPNPFNPATRIQYTLAEPGFVRLGIYNLNGQLVEQLVSAHQNAGVHALTWRCNLAGGIYFYRLEASGVRTHFSAVKKMLFIK